MEKFINCCVFIEPDDCANSLTDLLSVFKTLKVAACIKNQSEALELLNKKKIDILFINVDYADFLQLVHKPTFIIGICDQKHSNVEKRRSRPTKTRFFTTKPCLKRHFSPKIRCFSMDRANRIPCASLSTTCSI